MQERRLLHPVSLVWQRYHWLLFPALVFLLTRALVVGGGYFALNAISHDKQIPYVAISSDNLFVDMDYRFDAEWYLSIVDYGYWQHPGEITNTVFFPMYPLLIRVLMPVVGSAALAGILISYACLLGALIFLYLLTELEFKDRETARRAVLYIAIFPTAFFFSAIYTESAFLLFSVGAVYLARRQLWAWASLMALFAEVTRVTGILIWGVILLEWMHAQGWTLLDMYTRQAWANLFHGIRKNWLSLIVILLTPLSLISLILFFRAEFGNPWIFVQGQEDWGRQATGVAASLVNDIGVMLSQNYVQGAPYWFTVSDVTAFVIFLVLVPFVWRRLGESYALYMILALFAAAISSTFSMSRFVLVLFPAFMLLAHWGRNTWFDRYYTIICAVLLGVATAMFVNWAFVA